MQPNLKKPPPLSADDVSAINAALEALVKDFLPLVEQLKAAEQTSPDPVASGAIDAEQLEWMREIARQVETIYEALENELEYRQYYAFQTALAFYNNVRKAALKERTPELVKIYKELTSLLPDDCEVPPPGRIAPKRINKQH